VGGGVSVLLCAVLGLDGGTNVNYPDFCENHQFYVIYCVTLGDVLYFEEFLIHDMT
jgi:hypothetical protein